VAAPLNGAVGAAGNTFKPATGTAGEPVSALVAPDSLRQGHAGVQVMAVR
jgi:hypothetical protein